MRGVAILLEIAVKKRHGGGNSFDGRDGYSTKNLDPRNTRVGSRIREIRRFEKRIIRLIGNEGPPRMSPFDSDQRSFSRSIAAIMKYVERLCKFVRQREGRAVTRLLLL